MPALDRFTVGRETSCVHVAGTSQRSLARVLGNAYANGLLSQDTFLRRTDQLLGGGVIDPARLVGISIFAVGVHRSRARSRG